MSMNGMNVTVEIGSLLAAVRKYNPSADLTGLKAYLLDMVLVESDGEPAQTVQVPRVSSPEPVEHVAEVVAAPAEPVVPGLPAGLIGKATERGPKVMVNRASKNSPAALKEKEQKRKEFAELSSLSSKELMDRLVPTAGRRNEHNQVTDEGSEAASGGGELEIG